MMVKSTPEFKALKCTRATATSQLSAMLFLPHKKVFSLKQIPPDK